MSFTLKEIGEQQRQTWNKFSGGWKRWDEFVMQFLRPVGDELIKAVASKGGTTEAALSVFNEKGVGENLQKGIVKARDRASELSK